MRPHAPSPSALIHRRGRTDTHAQRPGGPTPRRPYSDLHMSGRCSITSLGTSAKHRDRHTTGHLSGTVVSAGSALTPGLDRAAQPCAVLARRRSGRSSWIGGTFAPKIKKCHGIAWRLRLPQHAAPGVAGRVADHQTGGGSIRSIVLIRSMDRSKDATLLTPVLSAQATRYASAKSIRSVS